MEDDFLTRFYESPRPEFAEALYKRLASPPPRAAPWLERLPGGTRMARTIGLTILALALIGACARAVFRPRYVRVSDLIWVYETKATPEYRLVGDDGEIPCATPEGPIPTPTYITVEEAKDRLRMPLRVPTWVPQGFELDHVYAPELEVTTVEQASISWSNAEGQWISLFAWPVGGFWVIQPGKTLQAVQLSAPPDGYEQVVVRGEPAVLLRGRWAWPCSTDVEPGAWDKRRLELVWIEDGVEYTLRTSGDYVSEEDLIRMADSSE